MPLFTVYGRLTLKLHQKAMSSDIKQTYAQRGDVIRTAPGQSVHSEYRNTHMGGGGPL